MHTGFVISNQTITEQYEENQRYLVEIHLAASIAIVAAILNYPYWFCNMQTGNKSTPQVSRVRSSSRHLELCVLVLLYLNTQQPQKTTTNEPNNLHNRLI